MEAAGDIWLQRAATRWWRAPVNTVHQTRSSSLFGQKMKPVSTWPEKRLLARRLKIWICCLFLCAQIFFFFDVTSLSTHIHTIFCFLPAFPPHTCGPLAQFARVDYSPLTAIMILHKQHLSAHLSQFPPRLSTLVYSSVLYFCIPASRVKIHATSTTEYNPQKTSVTCVQICRRQWQRGGASLIPSETFFHAKWGAGIFQSTDTFFYHCSRCTFFFF